MILNQCTFPNNFEQCNAYKHGTCSSDNGVCKTRELTEILASLTHDDKIKLSDSVIEAINQELLICGNKQGLTDRFQEVIQNALGVEE